MSYDRDLDQICPHFVVDETLYVDNTRQIVRPIKPIASLGSINLRLNGLLDIPSPGVQLPINVTGTANGPFTVTAGVNDTLVVKVNQGLPITVQSAGTGYSATIWIDGASTIAATIGFMSTHLYRGVNVTPGWSLVLDPQSIPALPYRMIVFDQPLRSVGDFVELSYNTVSNQCRRCGGTNVENDWRYGYTGEVGQVFDEALLLQEITKIMFTVRGTNPFHGWYGTTLTDSVGKKLTLGNFVQNLILSDVNTAFERWKNIKTQQQQSAGQNVTDKEFPFRLLSVTLQQSTQDPTVVYVNLVVQNRSTQPIQISRGIRLPQPLDLLGSTQQQGILQQSLQHPVLVG